MSCMRVISAVSVRMSNSSSIIFLAASIFAFTDAKKLFRSHLSSSVFNAYATHLHGNGARVVRECAVQLAGAAWGGLVQSQNFGGGYMHVLIFKLWCMRSDDNAIGLNGNSPYMQAVAFLENRIAVFEPVDTVREFYEWATIFIGTQVKAHYSFARTLGVALGKAYRSRVSQAAFGIEQYSPRGQLFGVIP
jgi:hypothetical protein